jgi:hypothetical protein
MLNPVVLTVRLTLCLQMFEMCVALLHKRHMLLHMIDCALIKIIFQYDHPFLSFDT